MLEVAASVGPVGSASMRAPLVVEEGAGTFRSLDDDVTAATTGRAFSTAARLASLSFERRDARPAVTGAQVDSYLIYEHGSTRFCRVVPLLGRLLVSRPDLRSGRGR